MEQKADVYLKLKPFIRLVDGEILWEPHLKNADTPTFEQFLKFHDNKEKCAEEREKKKRTFINKDYLSNYNSLPNLLQNHLFDQLREAQKQNFQGASFGLW